VIDIGLATALPGARASAIHQATADLLSQEGVAAFPSGHGVGLEYRDYPILVPDTGLCIDECVDRETVWRSSRGRSSTSRPRRFCLVLRRSAAR
jgi:hypothetical protein